MYNFWKHYVLFFGILESDNEEVWMQILVKVNAFFQEILDKTIYCHNLSLQSGVQMETGKLFGQP